MTFKQIREGRFTKIVVSYLAMQVMLQFTGSNKLFALTGGPTQPEFNSFTPIGTSDMVSLSSGDFNYNIPLMDVGGYPLNLAYDSGVGMDQEASWVGLGWNLGVGQINRQMRGLPDDFDGTKGDLMNYQNNLKKNVTVGTSININPSLVGFEPNLAGLSVGAGMTFKYNNYTGVSSEPSAGLTFSMKNGVSVGMNISSTAAGGVNLSPNANLSFSMAKINKSSINGVSGGLGIGTNFNSREGITGVSMNAGVSITHPSKQRVKTGEYMQMLQDVNKSRSMGGASSSISFINNTFTPMKRTAMDHNAFTFSFSFGGDIWGIDAEIGGTAFGTYQTVKDKNIWVPAFGYENTHLGDTNSVLDFNRENDKVVSKNTTMLASTNYTYDLYSIQGQGVSGMFRPHRSQTGFVYDRGVQDGSSSFSIGGEIEIGSGVHGGGDVKGTFVNSNTGIWNTPTANSFKEKKNTENDYQTSYFKKIGDLSVDKESDLLNNKLHGNKAMTLKVSGGDYGVNYNRSLENKYLVKNSAATYEDKAFVEEFRREKRETPNEAIQKITNSEAGISIDPFVQKQPLLKDHHTVGMKVLNTDGATYVYGEAAINIKKKEVTFATNEPRNPLTGLINKVDTENSISNSSGQDNLFNSIETPAYAHTYLLSSILSSDYEDLNGNGPDDKDLGAYTKFTYGKKIDDYKWRLPYYGATHDEGFKTMKDDQKASYVYGEKELKYITKIETKTHVACVEFEDRRDGVEASGENADAIVYPQGTNSMKAIKRIYLFSKPEYKKLIADGVSFDGEIDENSPMYREIAKAAIKIAHFEYDYSLQSDLSVEANNVEVPNNNNNPYYNTDGDNVNYGGKLTLKKVFFTYRGSEMGRYTPYKFNYDGFNPEYHFKSYDVWGNYKPFTDDVVSKDPLTGEVLSNLNAVEAYGVQSAVTAPEFPYVQQTDQELQDAFASAWSLSAVELPSGGKLNIEYESDDYQYVQNKKAMQMFKVVGSSNHAPGSLGDLDDDNKLYSTFDQNKEAKYLAIELDEELGYTDEQFLEEYIGDHINKPIFFRFLLNMHRRPAAGNFSRDEMDYVEGYFKIESLGNVFPGPNNKMYASIKMKPTNLGGGIAGSTPVNPISKAGWHFGRKYMNQTVYTGNTEPSSTNPVKIAKDLVQAIGGLRHIASGPNLPLREKGIAKVYMPDKSFIRLQAPNGRKFGGGVRVKKIQLEDNWDVMVDRDETYRSDYGQEYNYDLKENNGSSGVATFEPNGNKENPFVTPFYEGDGNSTVNSWLSPKEVSYTEKPIASSFYPSPTITYSRVEVKNLKRVRNDGVKITRHATGKVVNEFYTSKDFPTKSDLTAINGEKNKPYYDSNEGNFLDSFLNAVLNIDVKTHVAMTQGFVVETNDMDGKQKGQSVFDEYGQELSGVSYKYSVSETDGTALNNKLPVIGTLGEVETNHELGVDYEVVNDFRTAVTQTNTAGAHINIVVIIFGVIPVPIPMIIPSKAKHESVLKMATTTKVIHKSGILVEKIARDLGTTVSTKNKAWDAETGQILLTETINEYDDHYFNMTYPAHWFYEGMGKASNNLDITGKLMALSLSDQFLTPYHSQTGDELAPNDFLKFGDELIVTGTDLIDESSTPELVFGGQSVGGQNALRLWVVDINTGVTNGGVKLMNSNGKILNSCPQFQGTDLDFKIVRSGYRNLQMASMASVTSMVNPIDVNNNDVFNHLSSGSYVSDVNTFDNTRIVNASAVEYASTWKHKLESQLPVLPVLYENEQWEHSQDGNLGFNPYLHNVRGDYRAVKSYAYLTGRNTSSVGVSVRNEGFFTKFNPFYKIEDQGTIDPSDDQWEINNRNWTFASEVTQYSPYGAELENRDALGRYSATQYGYEYTLPTAVASNSEYREIGFDGFEESTSNHFKMAENQSSIIQTTTEESHTGNKSLALPPGNSAIFIRSLDEHYTVIDTSCPECPPNYTGTYPDCIPPIDTGMCFDNYSAKPIPDHGEVEHRFITNGANTIEIISTGAPGTINVISNNRIHITGPSELSSTIDAYITTLRITGFLGVSKIYHIKHYENETSQWCLLPDSDDICSTSNNTNNCN